MKKASVFLAMLAFIGALLIYAGPPPKPQPEVSTWNLAKIYLVGVQMRSYKKLYPEFLDEEPRDDDIRSVMVSWTNYNHCQEFDFDEEVNDCTFAIAQEEVNLVRLAYEQPDRFELRVR